MEMQIKNAVLVSLNISAWDANRQDKRVSKSVAADNDVKDERLCRLRKSLLPKNDALNKLYAVMRAARTFHYENTLAWMHDGPRMLTTANFDSYTARMRELKADFEVAVLDFVIQYEDICKDAELVLGKLYDETDYPNKETLKRRYGFDIKIQPMPASTELLDLGLEPAEADALRRKLEADIAETYQKANQRLWDDLGERLEKLNAKLSDEKATVREDTLASLKDLVDLLPRLNITQDERLELIAEQLKATLTGVSAESLKYDREARDKVAAETRSVVKVMNGFIGKATSAQHMETELPDAERLAA